MIGSGPESFRNTARLAEHLPVLASRKISPRKSPKRKSVCSVSPDADQYRIFTGDSDLNVL